MRLSIITNVELDRYKENNKPDEGKIIHHHSANNSIFRRIKTLVQMRNGSK